MKKVFADFMATRVLAAFRDDRRNGIPVFPLKVLPREELVAAGFVLDEQGQRTMSFA